MTITLPHTITEASQEDFLTGERYALAAIDEDGALAIPEELGLAWGPIDFEVPEKEADFNRMWVVYTALGDEIIVARADETLRKWDYREVHAYVPSGNFNPDIAFDADGNHTIVAEFVPAGEDPPHEVWVTEPPYTGAAIRRVAFGKYPRVASTFEPGNFVYKLIYDEQYKLYSRHPRVGELFIFYNSNDLQHIYFRSGEDGYDAEHELVVEGEGEKRLLAVYRVIIPDGPENGFRDGRGHLILFYRTESDGVVHYIITEELERYGRRMILPAENMQPSAGCVGMSWEDMRYTLNITIRDSNREPLPGATVTFHEHFIYPDITSEETDSNGETTMEILPFDTPYSITLHHPNYDDDTSWKILVWGEDETLQMNIDLEFTGGRNVPVQVNPIDVFGIRGIEWEVMGVPVEFEIRDYEGELLEDCTITVHAQLDQEEVVLVTDHEGRATTTLLPYETSYRITLEHDVLGKNTSWGLLVEEAE